MALYITGDKHGDFLSVFDFCSRTETSREDILIILGDAGINYHLNARDRELKELLSKLPITFFCIHGNHEERPYKIPTYKEKVCFGATAYVEDAYPNLIFAKDGEVYTIDSNKIVTLGGAYSIDKYIRKITGRPWFPTEQADENIMQFARENLERHEWKVDYVLSHAAPTNFEPRWAFIPGLPQELVDKKTIQWLQSVESKLEYKCWFCGHYHVENLNGPVKVIYKNIYNFYEAIQDIDQCKIL